MSSKRYELVAVNEAHGLHRIKALKDFGDVNAGDLGGFIESEANLSQKGNCWVFGNAKVFGNACVYGDAKVYGNACVYGDAKVFGNANVYGSNAGVYGNANVFGNAKVYGNACVYGDAKVYGNACVYGDAKVFGNANVLTSFPQIIRSDGYTFIYVPCGDTIMRVIAGCRYFTIDEFKAHTVDNYNNTQKQKETLLILEFLERQHECLNAN